MATRVNISKALEAEIREWYESKRMDTDGHGYIGKIIKLLDDEQGKRAAGSKVAESKTGLSYQELVALLRSYLGNSLLTPPKPNVSYIVKIVNKAKEQGLDYSNVEQILNGLRRASPRGPYRLADIIYNLDRYYNLGGPGPIGGDGEGLFSGRAAPDKDAKDEGKLGDSERVYTGRGDPDAE